MNRIERIDVERNFLHVDRDLSIRTVARRPGPPERVAGMSVGFVTMTEDAPHGGEMHPDGDEILYVVSGRVRVIGDSAPEAALELGAGEACVVRKGEWHRVRILEPTRLVHLTPGPGGEHRPPAEDAGS